MTTISYYYETTNNWKNSNTLTNMENLKPSEINITTLPEELRFNQNTLTVVLVYCALFVIAAIGNLTVFLSLSRTRHRKSRISLMIRHLAIADLVVTFIMIPIEVRFFNFNAFSSSSYPRSVAMTQKCVCFLEYITRDNLAHF